MNGMPSVVLKPEADDAMETCGRNGQSLVRMMKTNARIAPPESKAQPLRPSQFPSCHKRCGNQN